MNTTRVRLTSLVGTWQLASRTKPDPSGKVLSEGSLGAPMIGHVIDDAAGHVAAQLAAGARFDKSRPAGWSIRRGVQSPERWFCFGSRVRRQGTRGLPNGPTAAEASMRFLCGSYFPSEAVLSVCAPALGTWLPEIAPGSHIQTGLRRPMARS